MIYVRKVNKDDPEAKIVEEWLANDAEHQKLGITPEQIWDGEVALIYDEGKTPIMATRFHKALRVAIQFNPVASYRSAKAGKEVTKWFQKLAAESGCREVIVRAGGRAKKFAARLGFMDFIGQYLKV